MTSQTSEVSEAMVKTFQSNVEMLLERMQKVSGQGKHIAMDATVQVCLTSPLNCLFVVSRKKRKTAFVLLRDANQHIGKKTVKRVTKIIM